jgi:Ser/Thr protein kinase RdoA (MazF antagonist)
MTDNPFHGHEHRRPEVDAVEAARLLATAFGRQGRLRELGSHQDRNYLVEADDGRFVLKIARAGISRAELEAENAAIRHALAAGVTFELPVPEPGLVGTDIVRVETSSGAAHDLRLVRFVDGEPMDGAGHLAPTVLRAHGAMAAEIALALRAFDHPALDRRLQWDVRHAGDVVEALVPFASTPERAALARSAMARAATALAVLEP